MSQKKPDIIDVGVGARIRATRLSIKMSQTALALRLGITFQQVQKYEKGSNRVGASRLKAIADVLGVPVSQFFEPWDAMTDEPGHRPAASSETELMTFLSSKEGVELTSAFAKIGDRRIRQKAVELLKAVVAASKENRQ